MVDSRLSKSLIILAFALWATGCASNKPYSLSLMPAPDVFGDGSIVPFLDDDPISQDGVPGILYATDREPAGPQDKKYDHYTNRRGHVVRLGVAAIEFGRDASITWDEARRISLLKNRVDEYPLQVSAVEEFGVFSGTIRPFDDGIDKSAEPGKRFVAEIDRRLERSTNKDVYIYVHGYKVDFEKPVLVASELWHFLGYNGAFIAYSWPTTAKKLACAS